MTLIKNWSKPLMTKFSKPDMSRRPIDVPLVNLKSKACKLSIRFLLMFKRYCHYMFGHFEFIKSLIKHHIKSDGKRDLPCRVTHRS